MLFKLLLVMLVGVSIQQIQPPNVTEKCEESMKHTTELNDCAKAVADKYGVILDGNGKSMDQIKQEICCFIKDEEKCYDIIKSDCTSDDFKKIDDSMNEMANKGLNEKTGQSVDCSKVNTDNCASIKTIDTGNAITISLNVTIILISMFVCFITM